jgi:hypothetical protein
MKKILLLILVGILLLSGINAVGLSKKENTNESILTKSITFSVPRITQDGKYIKIQVAETDFFLRDPGKPEMPMDSYSFDLPFGVKNIDVKFTRSTELEFDLAQKIIPSPEAVADSISKKIESATISEDISVYSSAERYPKSWYEEKITCGLDLNKGRVTHVTIHIYPVQYSPALNKAYYIKEASVEISYDPPAKSMTYEDEYDLVIIAPQKFSGILNKLVTHKNQIGTKTFLKTTEEIYAQYSGVDKPEQIKYFIKDAIETNNILYVLLVGGLKSLIYAVDKENTNYGSNHWHVPVRYTNIVITGDIHDCGTISDLYYADIYKAGGEFDDWDSNNDGIIAKWSNSGARDVIDFDPDVYVGRLPCVNMYQLRIVVNKIINYETSTPTSDSWYNRMVGIAGMSFAQHNGQPDGEYLTDMAMGFVEDIIDEEIRVYASNVGTGGLIPEIKDTTNAFTNGARYIYMSGHGNPLVWVTHPADTTNVWMQTVGTKDLWRIFNSKKLPVAVVGGCHNGQFNLTLYTSLKSRDLGNDHWYWTHGNPGAACFCWKLMILPFGGAVATVGGTGLTVSWVGIPYSLNHKLGTDFFYEIGQQGATTFGQAHYGSIHKFLQEETIGLTEAHALAIWTAFGDPSIKIA